MRKATAISALLLATALCASGANAMPTINLTAQAGLHDNTMQNAPSEINRVEVVTMDDLSLRERVAINYTIAQMTPDQLRELRQIITAEPQLESALEEFGSSPSQVIAVTFDEAGLVRLVIET